MSAPIVLILAAGQGTRMRSQTPKVLHELCGRPMVLWPVRAALEAGAGRVVVVDSPERALEHVLPPGVDLAVQERANGTGGAVGAAMSQLDSASGGDLDSASASGLDPDAPIVVLSGDVPLVDAEAIRRLIDAHLKSGAAATMLSTVLDDPSGYGRVVRDASGTVERVVETKEQGDSTPEERLITEVNTGIYAFQGHALREALPRLSADNAQGELYLPEVLDLLGSSGALVERSSSRTTTGARRQRPGGAGAGQQARAAGDPRAAHARGGRHRGPRRHGDRRRGGDRPRHGDRALHDDQGEHEDR